MTTSRFVQIVEGYPSIDVGALRHKVKILSASQAVSDFDEAGPKITWEEYTDGWAAIEAVRGTDTKSEGQMTSELFMVIAMWYQAGILPNMRVLHPNGSTYVIQAAEDVREMNVVIVLTCVGLSENT